MIRLSQAEQGNFILAWLRENVDHIVAASNFSISIFMFILGSIVLYYIFKAKFTGKTDIHIMMCGIAFEAFGWAIHRTYWGLWRTARLYQKEEMQQWFIDHAYLALIPSCMVMIGLVLIIGPAISWMISAKSGRHLNYTVTLFFVLSTWWFAYWQLEQGFKDEKIRKNLFKKNMNAQTKVLVPNKPPVILKNKK